MKWFKSRSKKKKPDHKKEEPFFNKGKRKSKDQEEEQSNSIFFNKPKKGIKVGAPNDASEKEADKVADEVVEGKNSNTATVEAGNISSVQRYMTNSKEDELGTNTMRIEKDKYIQEQAMDGGQKEEDPGGQVSMQEEEQVDKQDAGGGEKEEDPGGQVSMQEEEQVDKQDVGGAEKEEDPGGQVSMQEEEQVDKQDAGGAEKEEDPGGQVSMQEEEQIDKQDAGGGEKEEDPGGQVSMQEEEQVDKQDAGGGEKEEDSGGQVSMQEEEQIEKAPSNEKEEEPSGASTVQTKSEGAAKTTSPKLTQKISERKGKGKPLPEKTKSEMEKGFGVDFSDVNIHTDKDAQEMNKSLHAQAFAHGKDIYFNEGKFDTNSAKGKKLLAHELTHVVQQKGDEIKKKPTVDQTIQRSAEAIQKEKMADANGPMDFRQGNTISCAADIRPGDVFLIDGKQVAYTITQVSKVKKEDGSPSVAFTTLFTKGTPAAPKLGGFMRTWLTKDIKDVNPVFDATGSQGTVTGKIYRNEQPS